MKVEIEVNMGRSMKIGIIGLGGIAGAHARAISNLKGIGELIAVADIDKDRACKRSKVFLIRV